MKMIWKVGGAVLMIVLILSCTHEAGMDTKTKVEVEADTVVFAVIGDYGYAGEAEESVALMVKSWDPDFIITTGDNNYPAGEYITLNENIGDFYGEYILNSDAPEEFRQSPVLAGDSLNRFFPTPGNHDASNIRGLTPYLDYFTLPGNELAYRIHWGAAAFFSINSLSDLSRQKEWLQKELKESTKKFNIVFFHHSPYSPGPHGDEKAMQWPFQEWGADLVLTGHDHIYSRIEKSDEPGLHYIISGAGGKSLYSIDSTKLKQPPFTCIGTSSDYGALYGRMSASELYLAYYLINDPDTPFDELRIIKH